VNVRTRTTPSPESVDPTPHLNHQSPQLDQQEARARRGRRSHLGAYLYIAPAALFVAATTLYPLFYNINLSLYDASIQNFLSGTARLIGIENYSAVLADPDFWAGLRISLIYTLGTIAVMLIAGMGMALLLQHPFRGRNAIRALLFLPYVLPSVVAGNVWRWLLDGSYGLVNLVLQRVGLIDESVFWLGRPVPALIAVVIATGWTMAPFAMLLLIAGLQGVPGSLYEAAALDGAGAVRRFRSITVPLLTPVTTVVALLGFIYTFRTFDTIFIMTRGGPGEATAVLPIVAYQEAFVSFDLGRGAAVNTLMLIIPLVLALFYFRASAKETLR
jgi:multiple sugar transport system permease protein